MTLRILCSSPSCTEWQNNNVYTLLGREQMTCATAGLMSYLSISYLLAKLSKLLIHRFRSPKCVVAEIYVCSDISYSLKELPNEK